MSKPKSNLLGAIAIIVGTSVGAGIFGLPYVISKVGVAIGISYLIVLGCIALITTLAYGEVVLRTKGIHQFPEYARIYLGARAKKIALISLMFGFYGAMIAYLTEVSNFLYALIGPYWGGELITYRLLYFALIAAAIFLGLGMIQRLEIIMVFSMLLILALLIIFGIPKIQLQHVVDFNLNYLLLPYGVILFALASASAVPDMKNILADNKAKLKKAIIIGILIPLVVYIIFSVVIVGISGPDTTESAVLGLRGTLGPIAISIGAIFGILSMTTSFMVLGLVLKEVYQFDYKIHRILAWALVVFPPLLIVLLNLLSFIEVIGISGAIIGGVDGIIIISMFKKAKQKSQREPEYQLKIPNFITYIIYGVFSLGIIYEIYMVVSKIIS